MLADAGHLDMAYELLLQDTAPSWLHMVERGATTVWESWDGIAEDGVAHDSLNHYSKGAVISFLHRHVAGLRRRRTRVPHVPHRAAARRWPPVGRSRARLPLRADRVVVAIDGDEFHLTTTVPPGTTASGGPARRHPGGRRAGTAQLADGVSLRRWWPHR